MTDQTAIDPVCGMTIALPASATRVHHETVYHFCSGLCAARFDADADAYATVARLDLPGWGLTAPPGFLMKDPAQGA